MSRHARLAAPSHAQACWTWARPFRRKRYETRRVVRRVSMLSSSWSQPARRLDGPAPRQEVRLSSSWFTLKNAHFVIPVSCSWLYTQYLGEDANFKLASKEKGLRDIELAPGWGYFVEEVAYQAAVAACQEEREVSFQFYLTRLCYYLMKAICRQIRVVHSITPS